jgi:hypothetical protein
VTAADSRDEVVLTTSGANVNVLNPGEKSDMGESTAVHSVEVTVSAP